MCQHERYKDGKYCVFEKGLDGMRLNKVVWLGTIITHCEDCGADISEHHIVPYKTPEDYLKEVRK